MSSEESINPDGAAPVRTAVSSDTSFHPLNAGLNLGSSTRGIDRNMDTSPPPQDITDLFFARRSGNELHRDPFFYGPQTSQSLFENGNPLHIDIGAGGGDYSIGQAVRDPSTNFLGVEIHTPSLYDGMNRNASQLTSLKTRTSQDGNRNLLLLAADFAIFAPSIPPETVAACTVRFPPPITFEHKYSADLLSPRSVWAILLMLQTGGTLTIATDSEAYVRNKIDMLMLTGAFSIIKEKSGVEVVQSRYQRKAQEGLSKSKTHSVELVKNDRVDWQHVWDVLKSMDPRMGVSYYKDSQHNSQNENKTGQ